MQPPPPAASTATAICVVGTARCADACAVVDAASVGAAARITVRAAPQQRSGPATGEHNDGFYRSLGLSAGEIEALRAQGVKIETRTVVL